WKTINLHKIPASYFQIRKPILETDYDDQLVAIHWNPGTEEALQVNHADVIPFYKAYRHFWSIIQREDLQTTFRMQPGDCMVFNNRRMGHSRTEFALNGGERLLEGCYVTIDDMR
uniref:TauD/TfdA-like domain-containing protein n=1 Tax=Ciona savignyi TaxID=51511 RepID=H2YB88_CIOSA